MMFFIGCDPEIFVGDSNGPRSIVGRVGGTKDCPRALPIGEGFGVQEDNVALEFNVPPSNSKEMFVKNVGDAMQFLDILVQDQQLHFLKDSAISFPDAELQTMEAQTFGCDPDYNVYTGRKNPRPKAQDKNLRSCGGHIHIGVMGTKYENVDIRDVIRWIDLTAGVPSVLMDNGLLRKQLYGKAGAYRIKPYGGEYRSLSNFWVFDEATREWAYDATERALEMVYNGVNINNIGDEVRSTIDNNDRIAAARLCDKYNLKVLNV
jgi:hypothetical protein